MHRSYGRSIYIAENKWYTCTPGYFSSRSLFGHVLCHSPSPHTATVRSTWLASDTGTITWKLIDQIKKVPNRNLEGLWVPENPDDTKTHVLRVPRNNERHSTGHAQESIAGCRPTMIRRSSSLLCFFVSLVVVASLAESLLTSCVGAGCDTAANVRRLFSDETCSYRDDRSVGNLS